MRTFLLLCSAAAACALSGCLADDDDNPFSLATCGSYDSALGPCEPIDAVSLDSIGGTWRLRTVFTGGAGNCSVIGLEEPAVDRITLGPGTAFTYRRFASGDQGLAPLDTLSGRYRLDSTAYGASATAPALVGEYTGTVADTPAQLTVLLFDRACDGYLGATAGNLVDGPARFYVRDR